MTVSILLNVNFCDLMHACLSSKVWTEQFLPTINKFHSQMQNTLGLYSTNLPFRCAYFQGGLLYESAYFRMEICNSKLFGFIIGRDTASEHFINFIYFWILLFISGCHYTC